MKRMLSFALVLTSLSPCSRAGAEDGHSSPTPENKPAAPAATCADNRGLFESAFNDIQLIKRNAATTLTPCQQRSCLIWAADLAELGGSDKDAKHLRDLAVKDQSPPTLLELLARRQAQLDALQEQVSYLRRMTHTEQTIQVDVRVVEAARSTFSKAGIKLSTAVMPPKSVSERHAATTAGSTTDAPDADNQQPPDYFKILDELRTKDLVKELASPSIITVSGRPAYFHSGGKFPHLKVSDGGDTGVDFQSYGTEVNVSAVSLSSKKVRMELKTRISQLDPSISVEDHGKKLPGLNIREWDTGLELESGETFVGGELSQGASDGESAHDVVTLLVVRATLTEPTSETGQALSGSGYAPAESMKRK